MPLGWKQVGLHNKVNRLIILNSIMIELTFLDLPGQMLWFIMFFTPLIIVPLAWRLMQRPKIYGVLVPHLFAYRFLSIISACL
jgi:hypothetical protein